MIGRRAIAANTAWNIAGQAVPSVVALLTIPPIISGLGVERFAVLTLAWAVVGYVSLFDLGLGRAVTKSVAELTARGEFAAVRPTVWTAWALLAALGAAAGIVVWLASPWLVSVLRIPAGLRSETIAAFRVLSLGIPLVVFTSGARGVLEAVHRFDLANIVRVPAGIASFVLPLIIVQFTPFLPVVIGALIVSRVFTAIAYAFLSMRAVPHVGRPGGLSRQHAAAMARFGAWITVSNVISPLMVSADRFFISGLLSLAAVTYYVTPYELVTRLLLLPGALVAVLFPAMTAAAAVNMTAADRMLRDGVLAIVGVFWPLGLLLAGLAPDILNLWVGEAFGSDSANVMRLITLGVLTNAAAHVPSALVQARGRADLTAKLHLLEAPLYLVLLVGAAARWGIAGVALAWAARTTIDMLLLFIVAARLGHRPARGWRELALVLGTATVTVGAASLPGPLTQRLLVTLGGGVVAALTMGRTGFGGELWRGLRRVLVSRSAAGSGP